MVGPVCLGLQRKLEFCFLFRAACPHPTTLRRGLGSHQRLEAPTPVLQSCPSHPAKSRAGVQGRTSLYILCCTELLSVYLMPCRVGGRSGKWLSGGCRLFPFPAE